LEHYAAPTDGVPDSIAEPDIVRLRACLEKLPTRERAIAILTFYAEQSGDQIARELSMTPGNVRVVRHRAVAHLQECMGLGDGEVT
jgi:RNA polymerase sigma-70 factor (ECF subfamily)